MKLKVLIIILFIGLNYSSCNSTQEAKCQSEKLVYYENEFSKALNNIFVGHHCDDIYKCYADSTLKLNEGVLFSEELVSLFKEFRKSDVFDSTFLIDSHNRLICTKNSIFIRKLECLSKEYPYFKTYLDRYNSVIDITPSLVSSTLYFVKSQNIIDRPIREFLFLHFAAVYYIVSNYPQ